MSNCINPADQTTAPEICGDDDLPSGTNCDIFTDAVTTMRKGKSDKPSGNYQQALTTCYAVDAKLAQYGTNDIFDIKALQNHWSDNLNPQGGNINCERTIYPVFDSTGKSLAKSSYGYWQDMQQECITNGNLDQCYSGNTRDGTTCKDNNNNVVPSMLDDFKTNFTYTTSSDGGMGGINFNFDCRDPDQKTFTQCKQPGWDYMTYQEGKGWVVGNQSVCNQNPIPTSDRPTCTDDPDETCGKDGSGTCCSENNADGRPNIPSGENDSCQHGCCLPCKNWTDDQNNSGLFSYNDTKNQTTGDILSTACDSTESNGGCCINVTTHGDGQPDEICRKCSKSVYDMSDATITFTSTYGETTMPYTGKYGVAATPSLGNTTNPKFSDVRECLQDGTFAGQCQGLVGCGGLTGGGTTGDNVCDYGYSYSGSYDVSYSNPGINCPNLYTIARLKGISGAPSLPATCTDGVNTNSKGALNVTSITIPEGAWVTGYYSASQNGDWSTSGGICAAPDQSTNFQKKYAVQMGCGQYTDSQGRHTLGAYASTYEIDKNGTWHNYDTTSTCKPVPINNNKGVCANGNVVGTTHPDEHTCTFTGALNEIPTMGGDTIGDGYGGFTFGFMPGYYNSNYNTTQGPCNNPSGGS